ncbi:non-ribosomal peptide synthetase [Aspergillus egyptiacus]|nr:non-ribosomal peptide synthetase [Aspergillus egyptiacus]
MPLTTHQPGQADPDSSDTQDMPDEDLAQIWQWNKTSPAPILRCVHEICEETARQQPDGLAICAWDGELRYGELIQLATKLADWLIYLGVKPGMIVPLCFEKSMWTTVAMLAVLKAGAAFVMLDISLPTQRLQAIVESVRANLIVSSEAGEAISSSLAETVIAIDQRFFVDRNIPGKPCSPPVEPSSVMYLTFTSGSTGTPKGAMITHANYAAALYHQASHLGFTTESRIYDFSSYSFDATVSHAFTILAAGGCLCVPSEHDRKSKLAQSITSLRANVVALTPSVARLLDPDDTPTLESLLLIGEAVHLRDVHRWWGRLRVLNVYGPSECTPYGVINSDAESASQTTRIGKGAGMVTWVVDPENHDRLLPLGQTGELLLEGPLVGEGYLNDADRTARVFIQDPVWLRKGAPNQPGRCGQRFYKTGDLVHYNDDGSLTYIGRKDTQIKIHGQRAELQGIECCLEEHIPEAEQVVVDMITVERAESGAVLAAFTQRHQTSTNVKEQESTHMEIFQVSPDIKDVLAQRLPAFMVPSIFFSTSEIPRTLTGKLDRRKLCKLGSSCFQQYLAAQKHVEKPKPTSHVGTELQRIWGEVLAIDPASLGLDDNFFRLGGDSIAAMQVVSKAQKAGFELTVLDVFQYPTLGGLEGQSHPGREKSPEIIPPYALLEHHWNKALPSREIVAQYQLDPEAVEDAYPCTPLQEGLLSLSLKEPGTYMVQRVLALRSTTDTRDFCRAWAEVARSMAILRTRIIPCRGMGFVQLVLREDIQWIHTTGLQHYLERDKTDPMGPGKPLARYAIVTDNRGMRRWFVWTLHHALYDGWSMPLILDRVNNVYDGIQEKQTKAEFKAFIKYVREQNHDKMAEFWSNNLAGCDCTPFPSLPSSVLRLVTDSEIIHTVPCLDIHPRDATPSAVVHSAWALLVSCMTNSDKVVFGITTSGRSAPVVGIEEIIGPTIATVPLYVRISPSQSVSEYLATMQQRTASMIPFEQFGLHRIAKASADARQACMFQTLLIIQPEERARTNNTLGEWEDWLEPEWDNTFALVLEVQLGTGHVRARFDSNVIKPWMVQDLLDGLDFVVKQLGTAGPDQRITDIALVPPPSLERTWGWNATVPSPVKATIHQMVEKRVEGQPTRMAIRAWDGNLTYRELDQLANKLAIHLINIGLGPPLLGAAHVVPLCFEKSMWTIVAILGVLKSGAGFVLLNPSLPECRLQSMIKQIGSRLLLSSQANMELSGRLSEIAIQVGPDLSRISSTSATATRQSTLPSSTMYAVFTSGSTGIPKGVVVSHENFCSAVHYQSKLLGFTRESRVLDFASYAFDAAVHNALATLAVGGCLCIPSEQSCKGDIGSTMATMRPTIANLTPTVARLLDPATVYDLKTLILLGEAVTRRDIERWELSNVRVINTYGPAECTSISTINASASSTDEATLIGKGAGLMTWIVHPEDHNRLLPPGCTGELLLEGPLVGVGYMNLPSKTTEAFVEDPEWLLVGSRRHPGRRGRLYKIGDLVQYHENGSLKFMGRKDNQVKIRGQRLELGDIEYHVSASLPTKAIQVVAEVVVPEKDRDLKPVLVAFIHLGNDRTAAREETPLTPKQYPMADLAKKRLFHRLSIVPEVFLSMQELPLTATGKVDRKRLREIGQALLRNGGGYVFETSEPSLPCDSSLGGLISEDEQPAYTLAQKVNSMRPSWVRDKPSSATDGEPDTHSGFEDVFLHLSGLDSVNMMELTSFIARHFNVQVGMQYVMDKATSIRSLAQYLVRRQTDGDDSFSVGAPSARIDLMEEINRHDSRILAAQQALTATNNIQLTPPPTDRADGSFTVFLTGANGFVGSQILRQLLEHRQVSRVICLVRGDTDDAARHRTITKAKEALWWTDQHAEKLGVWQGDLSLPKLGLDSTRWDTLTRSRVINAIIHNGAAVHWTKSYDILEAANVGSTMELLLAAVKCPWTRFLYITGGRPWKSCEERDVVTELSAPDAIAYSQTKLVSEIVVRRAAARNFSGGYCSPAGAGNNIAVLNPGWVIGTPTEGYSNTTDYLWRLTATCIKLGVYNAEDAEGWLSVSDVTTTAEAIVDAALGTKIGISGERYAADGMAWRDFWAILEDLGYALKGVSLASWMALVGADIEAAREQHPLWPLKDMIGGLQKNERVAGRPRQNDGDPDTLLRLKMAVRRGAEFLAGVGFLPAPPDTPPRREIDREGL